MKPSVPNSTTKKTFQHQLQRNPSADSLDPLTKPSTRAGTPSNASVKQKFSVVLGASPSNRYESKEVKLAPDEGTWSDLSPQFKKQMKVTKQTPVPLPLTSGMGAAKQKQSTVPLPQRQFNVPRPAMPQQTGIPQAPLSTSRGRPKGWKPGMSYSRMRGRTPTGEKQVRQSKSDTGLRVIKRRGRPPKQPSPPPVDLYHKQKVKFMAFLCEWEGCKAELHNLETLRRHVHIVHLRRATQCRWGQCRNTEIVPGFVELKTHMEEQHLVPFGWHIGDGPSNNGMNAVDEDHVPDFLKDADGKQVTPSVRGQQVEDYITWRDNRRKLRALLVRRDENLPSEESDGPPEEGEVDL